MRFPSPSPTLSLLLSLSQFPSQPASTEVASTVALSPPSGSTEPASALSLFPPLALEFTEVELEQSVSPVPVA